MYRPVQCTVASYRYQSINVIYSYRSDPKMLLGSATSHHTKKNKTKQKQLLIIPRYNEYFGCFPANSLNRTLDIPNQVAQSVGTSLNRGSTKPKQLSNIIFCT